MNGKHHSGGEGGGLALQKSNVSGVKAPLCVTVQTNYKQSTAVPPNLSILNAGLHMRLFSLPTVSSRFPELTRTSTGTGKIRINKQKFSVAKENHMQHSSSAQTTLPMIALKDRKSFIKAIRAAKRVASGKRAAEACAACKKSRVRCDDARPCQRCRTLDICSGCEFRDKAKKANSKEDQLQEKVVKLESSNDKTSGPSVVDGFLSSGHCVETAKNRENKIQHVVKDSSVLGQRNFLPTFSEVSATVDPVSYLRGLPASMTLNTATPIVPNFKLTFAIREEEQRLQSQMCLLAEMLRQEHQQRHLQQLLHVQQQQQQQQHLYNQHGQHRSQQQQQYQQQQERQRVALAIMCGGGLPTNSPFSQVGAGFFNAGVFDASGV